MNAESSPRQSKPVALVIGQSDARLWGMTAEERLDRMLARAGVRKISGDGAAEASDVMVLRGDFIYEERLLRALLERPGTILCLPAARGGGAVAAHVSQAHLESVRPAIEEVRMPATDSLPDGVNAEDPETLASAYDDALRKRAAPYVFPIEGTSRGEMERRTFHGAYKGVTDLVTKWVWPEPARHVTRWLSLVGVTPNAVTTASLACVLVAMYLFAGGHFLWGLVAAWLMTFLDTVDGKLARVTLTSSKWGNVFDHGIDLVHPPFWYWAWWHGLFVAAEAGSLAGGLAVGADALAISFWLVVVGYVVGRLQEGLFIWQFGIEMHAWRRVDSLFRQITARRNPNLLILMVFTLAGRPDVGLVAVAVWTALSLAFHFVRIGQAFAARARGRRITSWLNEPA